MNSNLGDSAFNVGLLFHIPTLEMLFSMLDFYFIYQPWKYFFQCWTFISYTNLGNAFFNVGLLLHLPTLVI